jgi:hypothetical protein
MEFFYYLKNDIFLYKGYQISFARHMCVYVVGAKKIDVQVTKFPVINGFVCETLRHSPQLPMMLFFMQ